MSIVRVLCNQSQFMEIERYSIECPFCHSKMTPNYLFIHDYQIFAECSNSECGRHMILGQDYEAKYTEVLPNSIPGIRSFSDTIKGISPNFESIYNQAFCAEQLF